MPAWASAMTRSWHSSSVPKIPISAGGPAVRRPGRRRPARSASAPVRPIDTGTMAATPRLGRVPSGVDRRCPRLVDRGLEVDVVASRAGRCRRRPRAEAARRRSSGRPQRSSVARAGQWRRSLRALGRARSSRRSHPRPRSRGDERSRPRARSTPRQARPPSGRLVGGRPRGGRVRGPRRPIVRLRGRRPSRVRCRRRLGPGARSHRSRPVRPSWPARSAAPPAVMRRGRCPAGSGVRRARGRVERRHGSDDPQSRRPNGQVASLYRTVTIDDRAIDARSSPSSGSSSQGSSGSSASSGRPGFRWRRRT